jgi:ubiquinone/menaquinone biosynthesis C-methylase UbiE
MRLFAREFALTAETHVLDVGGTPDCWRWLPVLPRLVFLNTPRAKDEVGESVAWVAGDGRALPFADRAFDIVFSNSVIEHVGDTESQRRFAAEVMRVGRAYWVQTPNRWFPLEQHLLTPLIHWLPKGWQQALVPRFTVWSMLVKISPDRRQFYLEHYLSDVKLLGTRELKELFPRARVVRERFCGWTKSLIAFQR